MPMPDPDAKQLLDEHHAREELKSASKADAAAAAQRGALLSVDTTDLHSALSSRIAQLKESNFTYVKRDEKTKETIALVSVNPESPINPKEAEIQALQYIQGMLLIVDNLPPGEEKSKLMRAVNKQIKDFEAIVGQGSVLPEHTHLLANLFSEDLEIILKVDAEKASKQVTMARDLAIMLKKPPVVATILEEKDKRVCKLAQHVKLGEEAYQGFDADFVKGASKYAGLKKGCDLFLMSPDDAPKISNKTELYLYRDPENGNAYYYTSPTEKHKVELKIPESKFTSDKNNPTKCEDPNISNEVINVTSKLGHTNQKSWLDNFFDKDGAYFQRLKECGVCAPPSARWLPIPGNVQYLQDHQAEVKDDKLQHGLTTNIVRMGTLCPFDIKDKVLPIPKEKLKQSLQDIFLELKISNAALLKDLENKIDKHNPKDKKEIKDELKKVIKECKDINFGVVLEEKLIKKIDNMKTKTTLHEKLAVDQMKEVIKQTMADRVAEFKKNYKGLAGEPIEFSIDYTSLLSPMRFEENLWYKDNNARFVALSKKAAQEVYAELAPQYAKEGIKLVVNQTNSAVNKLAESAKDSWHGVTAFLGKLAGVRQFSEDEDALARKFTTVSNLISRIERAVPGEAKEFEEIRNFLSPSSSKGYDADDVISKVDLLAKRIERGEILKVDHATPEGQKDIAMRLRAAVHLKILLDGKFPYNDRPVYQRNLMKASLELIMQGQQAVKLAGCKSARDRTAVLMGAVETMIKNPEAMSNWKDLNAGIVQTLKEGHQFRAMSYHVAVAKISDVHKYYVKQLQSFVQVQMKSLKDFIKKLSPREIDTRYADRSDPLVAKGLAKGAEKEKRVEKEKQFSSKEKERAFQDIVKLIMDQSRWKDKPTGINQMQKYLMEQGYSSTFHPWSKPPDVGKIMFKLQEICEKAMKKTSASSEPAAHDLYNLILNCGADNKDELEGKIRQYVQGHANPSRRDIYSDPKHFGLDETKLGGEDKLVIDEPSSVFKHEPSPVFKPTKR